MPWKRIMKTAAEEVECPGCKGTGVCYDCKGQPQYEYFDQRESRPINVMQYKDRFDSGLVTKTEVPCKGCKGDKTCGWCSGQGKVQLDEMAEIREKFKKFLVTGE